MASSSRWFSPSPFRNSATGGKLVETSRSGKRLPSTVSDASLTVDGNRLPLRLVSTSFPPVAELRNGLGENHLELDAILPAGGGDRRLVFENTHRARIAAYLVNALVPQDPSIRIT